MRQPVEVLRLRQAIEQFTERPPQELPDGVLDKLQDIGTTLGEFTPANDSPGHQEVEKVAAGGTDGTGEHYSKAARGTDRPSPGQREAQKVGEQKSGALSEEIEQAAQQIHEKVKGGREAEPEPSR